MRVGTLISAHYMVRRAATRWRESSSSRAAPGLDQSHNGGNNNANKADNHRVGFSGLHMRRGRALPGEGHGFPGESVRRSQSHHHQQQVRAEDSNHQSRIGSYLGEQRRNPYGN